jgi:hypothetical protein
MSPAPLPAYLLSNKAVLQGTMNATQAQAAAPHPAATPIVDYCRSQGFSFEPDLIARYIAALLTILRPKITVMLLGCASLRAS